MSDGLRMLHERGERNLVYPCPGGHSRHRAASTGSGPIGPGRRLLVPLPRTGRPDAETGPEHGRESPRAEL